MHVPLLIMLTHFTFASIPLNAGLNPVAPVIRGETIDERTGRPMEGVNVRALSDVGVQDTTSGADGSFLFLTLLPGTYRICTSGVWGYTASCRGEPRELFAGVEYEVTCILSQAIN